jgi:hypothetical protein
MKASTSDKKLMDKLVEFYNKKLTMSEIGNELGLNRNQVAGLITNGRRLGYDLPRRQVQFMRPNPNKGLPLSEIEKYKRRESQIKSDKVKKAQYKHLAKVDGYPYLAIPEIKITEIPKEGLPLLQIPANGCKFPIGQDKHNSHLFCSKPKAESSYCAEHLKVMWPNRYK